MVMDAIGISANVGDTVAYAQATRGAKPFNIGTVVKVSEKTVWIEQEKGGYADMRGDFCFVILQKKGG